MTTQVQLSEDGRYVIVTKSGPVSIADIKAARAESLPLYQSCDRTLVDWRLADISGLAFLELDDLGTDFKKAVPKCIKVAFVRAPGAADRAYSHLANIYSICGIETEIFETMTAARDWLLEPC